MDSFFHRYRNQVFLALLLGGQLLLLGYQVRRPDGGGTRLIRVWGLESTMPVEKSSQRAVLAIRRVYDDYIALGNVQRQNRALTMRVDSLELANQQLQERMREIPSVGLLLRYESGLGFSTLPVQVIGSGGTPDNNDVIYIDHGTRAGLARNMPVINPQGTVGKLTQVLGGEAQVLLITDPESGVGALVDTTAVHGILHGLGNGRAELRYVLDDEAVAVGARLITSGEDQVFPKGLPLGTVTAVKPGPVFQQIAVKPAADLNRLERVLVVTARVPPPDEATTGLTAAEIRQALLPSVPENSGAAAGSAVAAAKVAGDTDTPPAEGDALAEPATPPLPAASGPAAVGSPAGAPPAAKPATPGPPASAGGGGKPAAAPATIHH